MNTVHGHSAEDQEEVLLITWKKIVCCSLSIGTSIHQAYFTSFFKTELNFKHHKQKNTIFSYSKQTLPFIHVSMLYLAEETLKNTC